MTLPERIKHLNILIGNQISGDLLRQSQLVFTYREDNPLQKTVGLLMPPTRMLYTANSLFPVMDQNLPEGYLFHRLRECFPKQPLTSMHLLALIGENGIGRLGYRLPDTPHQPIGDVITRDTLLKTKFTPAVFDELIEAYLSTGIGVSGMQPKIMVPDRATVPVPNLIVKTGAIEYPGLAANEYLCLKAARSAGILTPDFELSEDGQMLVLDRFDITDSGERFGFEDIASLMGLCVRDTLSDRKYQGSYEQIADVLKMLGLPAAELERFFAQIAFSVMVRNGDAHLKNYAVIYSDNSDIRLSPMFDVVTTAIYRYARYEGGPLLEDQTMALKLFSGRHQSRTYPTQESLIRFAKDVCGVGNPQAILTRIAAAMQNVLHEAKADSRIPRDTLADMSVAWASGLLYAKIT